ncbi:MAG: hypothetical protein H0X34_07420 [Chthoniobacterales bacterium]|nr:hypothetical protein [Chthoniobacterales bacterium]
MDVIAVAGRTGAGTSVVAKLMRHYPGVSVVSFGDFLRKQSGGTANLQDFGQAFLLEQGPAAMVEGALAGRRPSEDRTLIIDGLRHEEVWVVLKNRFPNSRLLCVDPREEVLIQALVDEGKVDVSEARKRVGHPVELGVSRLVLKADYVTRGEDPSQSEEIAMRGLVAMIDPGIVPDSIQEKFSRSVLHDKPDRNSRRQLLMSRALSRGRRAIFELLTREGGCEQALGVAARLAVSEEEVYVHLKQGSLFAVTGSEKEAEFPIWQFTNGDVLPGFPKVLAALSGHNDLAKLRFFLSGNHLLAGESPLKALREDRVEEVVRAAERYLVQGAA